MSLYQQWQDLAEAKSNAPDAQRFWSEYFQAEQDFYAELLDSETVTGTVKALSERFGVDVLRMTGFLDGINDSLKVANDLTALEEDSEVSLDYAEEKLYYNMVAAKADWLYNLPQWDKHLSQDRRRELYREQKSSMTVVVGPKVGRNDPCPCGSGKKYKKCCGK